LKFEYKVIKLIGDLTSICIRLC